jgi:hypothetical protein
MSPVIVFRIAILPFVVEGLTDFPLPPIYYPPFYIISYGLLLGILLSTLSKDSVKGFHLLTALPVLIPGSFALSINFTLLILYLP